MRYSPAGISKKFSQIVSEVLTQIQGLITNIVLLVCTPNEIFVKKIGSGISSVRLKEKEYTQKIIHIPKPEIKRFEIKDYSALGLFSIGYW